MGILDLLRPHRSLLTAAAVASSSAPAIPLHPVGIVGGGNFTGRLQTVEPNELLREQRGYGRAGTQVIGEWADLALTNPYVTAGLDFICGPIADARIDIEADEENPLAVRQAEFLRWALEKKFRLSAHIDTAARGMLLSGFSLFEPRAILTPCPVLGRDAFALAALEQRLPNSLSPNPWQEIDGRLDAIEQQGPVGNKWVASMRLPASDVLLYSWKRQGNNWQGESQLRSVWYLAARIMPLLLKLVGVTTQREGAGLPVVFAKDDNAELTPGQRTELMAFLANANAHEASGIILPKGFDVKWVVSNGSDKGFILALWKGFGLVVLQQLGAQQLVLGTDNTGSRSVGEVHDARAMAFVRKVLTYQEGILNGDSGEAHSGLAHRLLSWNGLLSPDGSAPRVKLTPKRPEMQLGELAAAAVALKGAGLLTATIKDENAIRERAGLPPITDEERHEAKEEAKLLAPPSPFGAKPEQEELETEEEEEEEEEKPLAAAAQGATWKPWRPLRASERTTPFGPINDYFEQRREDFEREIRPKVIQVLSKAAPAIEAAMADGIIRPGEVADVKLAMGPIEKSIGKFLEDTRIAGAAMLRNEVPPRLRAAVDEDPDEVIAEADEVIAAQRAQLVRRMESRMRGELEREAIDALRTGGDATDVWTRAVARQIETGAFRADAGSITTKAFNVGRDEAARIMGGIASVEYSAILDRNTCAACERMDGETAEFGSDEHDRLVPPNRDCDGGDACRCLLVMIPEAES